MLSISQRLEPQTLIDFKSDVVYIHTSYSNIQNYPSVGCTEEGLPGFVDAELNRYRQIWNSIGTNIGCRIIETILTAPPHALLGPMDASSPQGLSRFVIDHHQLMERVPCSAWSPAARLADSSEQSNWWIDGDHRLDYRGHSLRDTRTLRNGMLKYRVPLRFPSDKIRILAYLSFRNNPRRFGLEGELICHNWERRIKAEYGMPP